MITCLIVDDEPLAQDVLRNFIARSQHIQLVGACSNTLEAFELMHRKQINLLFLDIRMPGINGLDFIRSLKDPPAVIFTTAFADHALAGFELDAVDYLLKPITYERFTKSMNKLLKIYPPPEPAEVKNYTYFKVSGQLLKIQHQDLLYVQSVKDYLLLCTTKGNHLTHMTMKYLCDLLPSPPFLRVHRSYLVNKSFVTAIDKNSVKIGNELLPIGENFRYNVGNIN